jgi:hypothetical protein
MPTIIRERGFQIMIYLNDHTPPHVHAWKAGAEARIGLIPVALWDGDLSPSDSRQAMAIVEANRDTLLAKWMEIHGTDDGTNAE